MSDTTDLTMILAGHQQRLNPSGSCICGKWPTYGVTWFEHLAEQITAAGFGPVRAVEAERDAALDAYAEREQRWHWNLIREQNAIRAASDATARAESAEAALAGLREGIEALDATYAEAPSLISPSDEWKKGWLRAVEQVRGDLAPLLAPNPRPRGGPR